MFHIFLSCFAGNGFIEYKEYEHLVGQRLVIANYKNKELMKEFRKFDKDGDGFITGKSLLSMLFSVYKFGTNIYCTSSKLKKLKTKKVHTCIHMYTSPHTNKHYYHHQQRKPKQNNINA